MVKAYELKALGEKIKAKALEDGVQMAEVAVEKLAKAAYLGFKDWMKESAVLSDSKVDDFLAPFYDQADPIVMPQIDKIDLDGDGK